MKFLNRSKASLNRLGFIPRKYLFITLCLIFPIKGFSLSPPACCEGEPPIPDLGFIRDCSCRAKTVNESSSLAEKAAALVPVCQCYAAQTGTIPGMVFRDELQARKEWVLDTDKKEAIVSHQGSLGELLYGSSLQVSFILGPSADPKTISSFSPVTPGASVRDVRELAINKPGQAERADLNTAFAPDPSFLDKVLNHDEVNPAKIEETCVSKTDFLRSKQIPTDDDFYKDLKLKSEESFDPERWNINLLKGNLKQAYKDGKQTDVDWILRRIKFLYANPLYLSTFAMVDDTKNYQKKLFSQIKKNFLPSNCGNLLPPECASKNRSTIANEDQTFFIGNLDLLAKLRGRMLDLTAYELEEIPRTSSQIAGLRAFQSKSSIAALLRPISQRRDFEDTVEGCANVMLYADLNGGNTDAQQIADAEATLSVDNALAKISKELNPGEFSEGYDEYAKKLCNSKNCDLPFESANRQCLTFAEYAKDPKHPEHRCSVNTRTCWNDKLQQYNKLFSNAYGLNHSDGAAAPSQNTFTSGASSISSSGLENQRQTAMAKSSFEALRLDDQERPERALRTPRAEEPRYIPRSVVAGRSSSKIVYTDTKGKFVSDTVAKDYFKTANNNRAQDNLNSYENANTTPVASAPTSAPTSAPASVVPATPSRPTAAPSVARTNRASVAPVSGTAPVRIAEDRSQFNQDETRINATISRLNASRDSLEKATVESQISSLEARNKDLEARIKEAERRSQPAAARAQAGGPAPSLTRGSATATPSSGNEPVTFAAAPAPAAVAPTIAPTQAIAPIQNFGTGPSSVTVPVNIASVATTTGGRGTSNATNFNFRYGSDAKISRASGSAIIVAGASSTFEANPSFAAAVNDSPEVNIGRVDGRESSLLASRDPETLAKYKKAMLAKPGTIIRLVFTDPNGSSQEIVVGKNPKGELFFPRVSNLPVRRLEHIRMILQARN